MKTLVNDVRMSFARVFMLGNFKYLNMEISNRSSP